MTIYSLDILFFSYLEPVCCSMVGSNVASWLAYRGIWASREASKVVWYSHILKNFPHFAVIHTVKGFGIVNKAEVDVFLEFSCFLHDATDAGILISGSLLFLNPAWTFGVHGSCNVEAWLGEFWALLCQHVISVQLCSLNILWHCPSLRLEWKLTISSPVATAEFS